MYDLELVKKQLEAEFPDLSFSNGKRIYGNCIIAKKSKYSGADIFVRKNKIVVDAAIPEMKTRFLIGAGVLYLKFFNKNFSEPSIRIFEFLKKNYNVEYS
jgi:hypothetical protein